MSETTRRVVLAGAASVSAAAVLAACGDKAPEATPPAGGSTGGGNTGALTQTSDIPVGGGKVFDKQKVVVTQPTAGQFKAFTAICTHQGCAVSSVENGRIKCPCHGSEYSITDGSVKAGPAPQALASKSITVTGSDIVLA
jgi:Rieske Fe-S protein